MVVLSAAIETPELQSAHAELDKCFSLDLEQDLLLEDELWLSIQETLLGDVDSLIPYHGYAERPIDFAREILNVHLTPEQEEICRSICDNVFTNVQASAGVGKSFLAAVLTIHYIFAVGGKVITTAPSSTQVDEILWSEIRELYDKNKEKLGGRRGRLFIRLTEKARGVGITSNDYDSNTFQGKHSDRLLIILDESCGITESIDAGAVACCTGSNNRLLRIGNPISDGNPFADACAKSAIVIKAWSHPNISWAYEMAPEGVMKLKPEVAARILKPESDPTHKDSPVMPQEFWDEDLPRDVIPGAISIGWIEMMRVQKGEMSSFWQSRIEAHFPENAEASIVPRSWFYAAVARYQHNPTYWDLMAEEYSHHRHGLDVGDGQDAHAHARWKGVVLYDASERQSLGDRQDTSRAAQWGLAKLKANHGSIAVDRTGVGAGTLSELIGDIEENSAISDQVWAYGFTFGAAAKNKIDYLNLKAEVFWDMRESFRQGLVAIAIQDSKIRERLAEELAKTYYEEMPSGKTRMEDKKKTKKRLKRSPNLADAAMMAWHDPDRSGDEAEEGGEEFYIPTAIVLRY